MITIYHVMIYERVIHIRQRFSTEYFSSLDYNLCSKSDLSTHKWYMICPTQFSVNKHTQEFLFKNFSNSFPVNLYIYIHGVVLFLAEKHLKCAFVMVIDSLLTWKHWKRIAKSLVTSSWRLMASEPLENKLVSSVNNTGSVFRTQYKDHLYRWKRVRDLK